MSSQHGREQGAALTRRRFLQASAAGAGATAAANAFGKAPAVLKKRPPNFVFVHTDQQALDTISAYGCKEANTPHMDRLAHRGVSFTESHTANPVCIPARTSWYTGRYAIEHGTRFNGLPLMRPDLPDMGQWLSKEGYEVPYVGKWHIERDIHKSFDVIHGGHGIGEHGDSATARAAQGYIRNHKGGNPYFLSVGLLQPHDICYWIWQHSPAPEELRVPEVKGEMPELPPSFDDDPMRNRLRFRHRGNSYFPYVYEQWTDEHWRYYIWSYYRHVEMVDTQIGRVMEAIEDSDEADNTILIFSSDHGEGRGRHVTVTKNTLYEEVVKVPLIVSCPGRLLEDHFDRTSLVSGVDIFPTLCDFAGIAPPERLSGRSLRPLVEGTSTAWREFVAADSWVDNRMIRTAQYKYLRNSREELYDLENDPWEERNLVRSSEHAGVLEEHRKLLRDWESGLEIVPTPEQGWQQFFMDYKDKQSRGA